jgi:hypothetical protein
LSGNRDGINEIAFFNAPPDQMPRLIGNLFRVSLTAGLLLAPCSAGPTPIIRYAPAESLERSDVALIDGAEHEIAWPRMC